MATPLEVAVRAIEGFRERDAQRTLAILAQEKVIKDFKARIARLEALLHDARGLLADIHWSQQADAAWSTTAGKLVDEIVKAVPVEEA